MYLRNRILPNPFVKGGNSQPTFTRDLMDFDTKENTAGTSISQTLHDHNVHVPHASQSDSFF